MGNSGEGFKEGKNPLVLNVQNYYPFGMLQPARNFDTKSYKYGYNGKEKDDELKGEGVQYDYGFRIYDARIAKFLSVDPLTKSYPELTPYQIASNTPIQAIDLDGLEAYVIHGTTQTGTGVSFTEDTKKEFMRITGNTKSDDVFRWNAPINNDSKIRKVAAERLVAYILESRATAMAKGEIGADEPISLIGFSHGGNVAVQAVQMLNDDHGIKSNLITFGTPAKNSAFNADSDNWLFGNSEDPQGNKGINLHYHIRHINDQVWRIANAAGDKSDAYYSNPGITRNWTIPNSSLKFNGPIESHSNLTSSPRLSDVLKVVPEMRPAPAPRL